MNIIRKFINDEQGIETIEFIGLIAVAVALIIAVATIGANMAQKANDQGGKLDEGIEKINGILGT